MSLFETDLPVEAVLSEITKAFKTSQAVVLSAPPGAGKSTRVPVALMDAGLLKDGRLLLLEPRRMAARATASRTAALLGERVGGTVGYQIRFEKCFSNATRILVVTEGILTRRFIADPFLEGISFVVLDEFHERSVHTDLALMFVKELLTVRDDLRLLVMSATLDTERVSAYLGRAPVIESAGRTFPLTVTQIARPDERSLEERAASAAVEALKWAPDNGDVLVFLPGEPEIRRVLRRLEAVRLPGEAEVLPLFGALSGPEQDRVLSPGAGRRVVLATNIAETSLTIPGVSAVVDSGLRRINRFDPTVGLDRLETTVISQASADQRAGRAGRTGPGHVFRLWTAHEHKGRARFDPPEISRIDIAPVLLQLAAFHPGDPRRADWFEPPDAARLESGPLLLEQLGALERESFQLTKRGKRLAALPLHPRLGAILLHAETLGVPNLGAAVAALASERDVLNRALVRDLDPSLITDFDYRLGLFRDFEADGGDERAASRYLLNPSACRAVVRAKRALLQMIGAGRRFEADPQEISCGRLLLAGFPDRVAVRRPGSRSEVLCVGGLGLSFPAPQQSGDAFVIVEADAGERHTAFSGRIRTACAIDIADLKEAHPNLLNQGVRTVFNPKTESAQTLEQTRFVDLVIAERPAASKDPQAEAEALAEAAAACFPSIFSPDEEALRLVERIRFAARLFPEKNLPDVTVEGLAGRLSALCFGLRRLDEVRRIDWRKAVQGELDYRTASWLDEEVPDRIQVPSGSRVRVVYEGADKADGAPHLACRMQELFGLTETPRIAEGRVPVVIHLLAPNMRPCQVTRDLSSFWQNTYKEVRKELKGRYPKHYWPENPFEATPTSRVRPKGA